MKIKCKNENCLHEWNYSGRVARYLFCPKCLSFVPLDEYQFDLETPRQNNFKYKIRTWLLEHPEFNPYKFSSPTNSLSWYDTLFKTLTNSIRSLPNFLLIGGHKSGATSLMSYLQQHHYIWGIINLHFFEYLVNNKTSWYRKFFPTKIYFSYVKTIKKQKLNVGEMAATYFYHPDVPKRIKSLLPNVKLLLILRNPIDMTYSKYNHGFNQGVITESFDSIIKNELTRIKIRQNEPQLIINNPNFDNNVDSNYLRHGNYVYYLKKWLELFPRKQLHILTNEQLTNNPIETMEKVFEFLNAKPFAVTPEHKKNIQIYTKQMEPSTRKFLKDYFTPYNEELYKLLGVNFNWA